MRKTPATSPNWPHTLGLIGKYKSPELSRTLLELAFMLESRGVRVIIAAETADAITENRQSLTWEVLPLDDFGSEVDVAVVLGGDGSMLSAARSLARHHVPLIGVNEGKLGFITDVAYNALPSLVDDLLGGRFSAKQRFLLSGEVWRNNEAVAQDIALNDIVISRSGGRLIELSLFIDDEFISSQYVDGLIISTPTGSTAYALAAGGPIMQPGLLGFALVPLCAHTLSYRPLIVPNSSHIVIQIPTRYGEAIAHFDGQIGIELQPGDVVHIRRAPYTITFLHPPGYNYFAMLRQKLHWSGSLPE